MESFVPKDATVNSSLPSNPSNLVLFHAAAAVAAALLPHIHVHSDRCCCDHAQDLSLQHLTNIMWTFATFNHVLPSVSDTFIPELVERAKHEEFNAQQLCNLLWSMAIMQVIVLLYLCANEVSRPHGHQSTFIAQS